MVLQWDERDEDLSWARSKEAATCRPPTMSSSDMEEFHFLLCFSSTYGHNPSIHISDWILAMEEKRGLESHFLDVVRLALSERPQDVRTLVQRLVRTKAMDVELTRQLTEIVAEFYKLPILSSQGIADGSACRHRLTSSTVESRRDTDSCG